LNLLLTNILLHHCSVFNCIMAHYKFPLLLLLLLLMPSFHHSVAVLPFRSYRRRCMRMRTETLETSFRIHRDEETTTLIGCRPTAERQK